MNSWLYEHNKDNSARYILGEQGNNMLACFGINPSTATPEKLDPTLTRVRERARRDGYDGWVMFNIYPQRATNPNDMHLKLDIELHKENLKTIKGFFSEHDCEIWAAWGTNIAMRPYLMGCLQDISSALHGYDYKWIQIGKPSVQGHPHHPLYVKYTETPVMFDVWAYSGCMIVKN